MLVLENVLIEQGDFSLSADFAVPRGARVGILGPSGAGKSTLLAAIAGFLKPAKGRILWEGRDLTEIDPGERPVSIVFQDNNLFPHLTVYQNAALGFRPSLKLSADENARVHHCLARVGLEGYGERRPGALSGGQQSRVALARVLLRQRPLLLLDEPFAALGPALKTEMLDMVRDLADETGATALMVTHDPGDAKRFAQQTILLADGRAHAPQDTAALLENPPAILRNYLS